MRRRNVAPPAGAMAALRARQIGVGVAKNACEARAKMMTAPKELRVSRDRKMLTVTFPDHRPFDLPAEFLRVVSPSAEVQGHSPEQRVTVPGKRNVAILKIEPVGNYAVRITFDDMHDTGIFTWTYLHTLGHERDERWQAYLDELAEKGLSRD
jgi:DUF971 family protein